MMMKIRTPSKGRIRRELEKRAPKLVSFFFFFLVFFLFLVYEREGRGGEGMYMLKSWQLNLVVKKL